MDCKINYQLTVTVNSYVVWYLHLGIFYLFRVGKNKVKLLYRQQAYNETRRFNTKMVKP